MRQSRNLSNLIATSVSTVFLILFVLLTMNNVLPLKWQFPAWKLSPHLTTVKEETSDGTRTDYVNYTGALTAPLDKNYATVIKTFDQNGNCILERYFDSHGRPAVTLTGYSALRREFNADNKCVVSTYLDGRLHPIVCKNGYASIRRDYSEDGDVETWMYYDADGLPTRCTSNTYGVRYEYNENKKATMVTHLDADGNAMLCTDHYSICRKTYTADGKLYTETFYDENDNPTRLSNGQYGYLYENGKPVCLDRDGRRMFVLQFFLLHSLPAVLLIGILLLLAILLAGKGLTWLLLLLYLAFIAYMTVMNRDAGSSVVLWSIPPNYYLFFTNREILFNIWLFIPLGAILYKLSHMWEMIAFPIALSLLIEIVQLILDIGAFELSDLIANSLGGAVGMVVCYLLEPIVTAAWKRLRARL